MLDQIIRVAFDGLIFDIGILSNGSVELYKPLSDLMSDIDENGNHKGELLDSQPEFSYLTIAFSIIKNEIEKKIFGDVNFDISFGKDEGNTIILYENYELTSC
jgi:hypothetical protein